MQCNASKDIQHAVSMITFAKTKEKMPRSSSSSLHEECYYYVARVIMQINCRCLASPFYGRQRSCILSFCAVMPQRKRDRDLCDLHRACFGNDVAYFLFVQVNRSSPLKLKNSLAAKSDLCIHQSPSCNNILVHAMHIVHFVRFIQYKDITVFSAIKDSSLSSQ